MVSILGIKLARREQAITLSNAATNASQAIRFFLVVGFLHVTVVGTEPAWAQEKFMPRNFVQEASVEHVLPGGALEPQDLHVQNAEVNDDADTALVTSVRVRVRAIEARSEQGAQKQSRPSKLGRGLADLEHKLSELSFDSFKLLGTQQAQIELKKKYAMTLSNRDMLTLRPLYVEGKRTGLWLKWRDSAGLEILDTRLHFACGESMLAGANSNSESAVILAIDVSPLR